MNQQRLLFYLHFKHLIFLFDRKNTYSPTSRRCDREPGSNNCDFIKEFVDFVHAEDLQCKKKKQTSIHKTITVVLEYVNFCINTTFFLYFWEVKGFIKSIYFSIFHLSWECSPKRKGTKQVRYVRTFRR